MCMRALSEQEKKHNIPSVPGMQPNSYSEYLSNITRIVTEGVMLIDSQINWVTMYSGELSISQRS